MSHIVLIGLNHKTAPIELRERLTFAEDESANILKTLHSYPAIHEIVFVSTCNRVEALMIIENRAEALEIFKKNISESKQIAASRFENALYVHEGDNAVRHIFRVASSLDSMVVGEPQILGQIKDAYNKATKKKTSGVITNRLLHKAFFVAKRVRSETGIGDNAVSISYAAIELGRKIFGSLEGKKVLLIGAGEMAELAVEHLIRNKVGDIIIANRTFETGVQLAGRFNGKAVRIEEILECVKIVDIIISSTGSPDFILTRDQVKGLVRRRKNRPLFFIDIAVPRNIDPSINRLTNMYVYDIDELKSVIDENMKDREIESIKGKRIVDEAVINFRKWYDSLYVVPTIIALRNKIETIIKNEVTKTVQSMNHLAEDDYQAISMMTNSLVNKILHDPTIFLKSNGCMGDHSVYLDITRKLFKIDT